MSQETAFNDITRDQARVDAAAAFVMDEDTFRAFYDRTARGLWAYLARVTGDHQLADDLLQETFYRFLRAASTYESESHCRNSLYRIATNLACDSRRRSLTRAASFLAGHDIEHVPSAADAALTETQTDLSRAMSQLKPREREILLLAYAEGTPHSEIAHVIGVTPGSLKQLLFRARRKLAVLLGRTSDGSKS